MSQCTLLMVLRDAMCVGKRSSRRNAVISRCALWTLSGVHHWTLSGVHHWTLSGVHRCFVVLQTMHGIAATERLSLTLCLAAVTLMFWGVCNQPVISLQFCRHLSRQEVSTSVGVNRTYGINCGCIDGLLHGPQHINGTETTDTFVCGCSPSNVLGEPHKTSPGLQPQTNVSVVSVPLVFCVVRPKQHRDCSHKRLCLWLQSRVCFVCLQQTVKTTTVFQ